MEFEFRDVGETTILKVIGEVNLYNINELKKALFSLTDKKNPEVAIDMANVVFIDSSIIGALISMHKKVKSINGKFALIHVNEDLLHIIKQGSLDKFFTIYKSESELL